MSIIVGMDNGRNSNILLSRYSWAWRDGAVVKVLALHAWDPIWAPVLIPAAMLPIQLPACGPGKQSRTAQSFGTLHLCGRPRRISRLQIGKALAHWPLRSLGE